MGRGIAQLFSQSGHPVRLFDAAPGAAQGACDAVGAPLRKQVAKGKLDRAHARHEPNEMEGR
jgi:3-hydroxybutyryl-CoA dehydrogenase